MSSNSSEFQRKPGEMLLLRISVADKDLYDLANIQITDIVDADHLCNSPQFIDRARVALDLFLRYKKRGSLDGVFTFDVNDCSETYIALRCEWKGKTYGIYMEPFDEDEMYVQENNYLSPAERGESNV